MNSILLIEDAEVYQKSEAVIRICRHLKWPWNLLTVARHMPLAYRNRLYDLIAKHRYRWFGKKDHCVMGVEKYKNRFI